MLSNEKVSYKNYDPDVMKCNKANTFRCMEQGLEGKRCSVIGGGLWVVRPGAKAYFFFQFFSACSKFLQ
jgi:hypothetical protein